MRRCPHLPVPRPGGVVIETLILLLFGLTALAFVTVAVVRMITHRNRERDQARAEGFESGEPPRTDAQRSRDKQTAMIWGCAALAVPTVLVLAWYFTR